MLVLTRQVGQRIIVSESELTITVLAIRGNQVRLGITAPANVAVHRAEVAGRIAAFHDAAPRAEAPTG